MTSVSLFKYTSDLKDYLAYKPVNQDQPTTINPNSVDAPINISFLKKYGIFSVDPSKLTLEETQLLTNLHNNDYSYTQEYAVFDELFKQKHHLNIFANPQAALSNILKCKEEFYPCEYEKLKRFELITNGVLQIISHHQDELRKWNP